MNLPSSRKLALLILTCFAQLAGIRAADPIIQTKFTADPAPFVHDGVVYLYTSHDEDDAPPGQGQFRMKDWMLYTSTDMVNWTDRGTIASLRDFAWAASWEGFNNGAWAPQAIERDGKWYLYCPVHGRGIGVLVADNPAGPFTDPLKKPLIGAQYDSIDPTVFIDDDGQAYLYWGNPNLWCVKLNKDMISTSGEILKIPGFAKIKGQADPFHYQEGPWAYKRNGHYYMAYASTCCPEGIGYAMSDSPMGPWAFKGYIVPPDHRSSGNHPGIIDYKGKSYVFGFSYRLNFLQTDQQHERRSICVEEFKYNLDGTIPEQSWWDDAPPVQQIERLNPYAWVEGETIAWSEGIKSEPNGQGGMAVYPIREGAYIKVQGVDFGSDGAGMFTAVVEGKTKPAVMSGGTIELRVGSVDGALIGTLPVSYTGGRWQTQSTAVQGATGIQDLYLNFKGASAAGLCKLDRWQFIKKNTEAKLSALSLSTERYKLHFAPGNTHLSPVTVTAIYSDGTTKGITRDAHIVSENPDIATVNKGEVAGVALGESSIVASYEGQTAALAVIVHDLKAELSVRALKPSLSDVKINIKGQQPLTMTAAYFDGRSVDVTNTATYGVANPEIVSLKGGVITALAKGFTTILATFKDEAGKTLTVSINVAVTEGDPFVRNKAEDFNEKLGTITEKSTESGLNVGAITNGQWIKFSHIDLGTGAKSFEARVASASAGGALDVVLDRPDGPVIGTIEVKNTGGWQKWITASCEVKDARGVHDIYLKFRGGSGFLFNLNWWQFSRK